MRTGGARPPDDLADRRVTVVGLGRFGGGIGVTRWLCRLGAKVTVSDIANSDKLTDSLEKLEGFNVTLHLGSHERQDFLDTDLLVVSPAVPKAMPLLAEAASASIARTSEINLFLERCPARVTGVTGTTGKSTTAAMTARILARMFTTHLGGNIGGSLLESLDEIEEDHLVVLELSSFQLEDLPLIEISPEIALVTNFSVNHLDRHGTVQAYAEAKKNIFRFQDVNGLLILNSSCPETSSWSQEASGRVAWFDPTDDPFELEVPGAHNQANAQAAWTVARQFGIDRQTASEALSTFTGLPHRLDFILERDGVRYFNDSKSTTPEGPVVAMECFEPRRIVILVGGYDKGAQFDDLGVALSRRAKAVVAIGAARDRIAAALEASRTGSAPILALADDLPHALETAIKHAGPGDVVLFSPGCASYDMFDNYEQRGETFVKLVTDLR